MPEPAATSPAPLAYAPPAAAGGGDLGTWAIRLFGVYYAFTCAAEFFDGGIYAANEFFTGSIGASLSDYLPWFATLAAGVAAGVGVALAAALLAAKLRLRVDWPAKVNAVAAAQVLLAVLGVWWLLYGLSRLVAVACLGTAGAAGFFYAPYGNSRDATPWIAYLPPLADALLGLALLLAARPLARLLASRPVARFAAYARREYLSAVNPQTETAGSPGPP